MKIPFSSIETSASECPITGLKAYLSMTNTSETAPQVSVYSADNLDSFWKDNNAWYFDGHVDSTHYEKRTY